MVEAGTYGMYHPPMKEKMGQLETRNAELTALLANLPNGMLDILPSASAIHVKKVGARNASS